MEKVKKKSDSYAEPSNVAQKARSWKATEYGHFSKDSTDVL
jgi:hypothetical protein